MEKYIPKSALVAEIERRKQVALGWMETAPNDAVEAESELCDDILSFIDTLEVKEVKEVDLYIEEERIWKDFNMAECCLSKNDLEKISKHFFELGLKAQKGL